MYLKIFTLPIFLLFIFPSLSASSQVAYKIYTQEGQSVEYQQLLAEAKKAEIILFGELHNNPICHWLQLQLTEDLYQTKGDELILGAEMFESDDQEILNEYLEGKISEKTFKDEAKEWSNYATDYKPLVEFAKKNKISFIATNIPRRYANMVFHRGIASLDSLSAAANSWICPLPFPYDEELACYKEIAKATGGHGGENIKLSQAIKDATMSHFIIKNWSKGYTMIHFNGTYHSKNFESIYWYLKHQIPKLNILTIHSVESNDMNSLEEKEWQSANFIIQTPESMTKTH